MWNGTELKKCLQQHAWPSVSRYDDSFRGKARISLRLPPDQTATRKGRNLIKIWMTLTDCNITPESVVMVNHFSAEAEFRDYIDANCALESIENLPESKKLKAAIEQRAMISKGVISDWPSSIGYLWSVIQDKTGIISLERMYRCKWNSEARKPVFSESDNIVVIFKGVGVRDLKIFFSNVGLKVRPFVPQARQCFNCYRFGHTRVVCKSDTCCIVCGDKAHGTCDKPVKCRNCGGSHKSTYKQCPIFLKNRNINAVMAYNNVSFYRARQIVEGDDKPAVPWNVFTGSEAWRAFRRLEMCLFRT